jgi:ribosomal protein S27AE
MYGARMPKRRPRPDDRPPICPACGVTMGLVVEADGSTRYVCLECGFREE